MLKRVEIQRFMSCEDVVLEDIPPILVLVGRNGAGKTNLLRAIDWAARCATDAPFPVGHPFSPWEQGDAAHVLLKMDLADAEYTYEIAFKVVYLEGPPNVEFSFTERLWVDRRDAAPTLVDKGPDLLLDRRNEEIRLGGRSDVLRVGRTAPALPSVAALLPADDRALGDLTRVLNFLAGIRYYPLDEPNNPGSPGQTAFISQQQYASWLSETKGILRPQDSPVMPILHMWLERRPDFDVLVHLLGDKGLDLVEGIEVHPVEVPAGFGEGCRQEGAVYRHVLAGGWLAAPAYHRLPVRKPVSSTRRVLRILVSLTYDRSSVMLLEQPEDSIHAALMRKLIGLLKTNADGRTLIVASHAASVFNSLEPENLRLVAMVAGQTKVRSLKAQEIDTARKFMSSDGTLAEFMELME